MNWTANIVVPLSLALNGYLISNFTVNLVKTPHTVVLGCTDEALVIAAKALIEHSQVILPLNINGDYNLGKALTRRVGAKTSVILDCSCTECRNILHISSERKYFNKTYQWMIWDPQNIGLLNLIGDLKNIGPNTQVTYVNTTRPNPDFSLYDVHSKGRHLNASIEVFHYGDWINGKLTTYRNLMKLQGIQGRDQFNRLTLRAACVIDRDNITTNEQIVALLSSPIREDGVTAFIRYHYNLLVILQDRFNFTPSYRNPRGWAGRLGNGTFRIGYLGVVARNEVDIGASGAFNRKNRFAEFDTIHQSWKFESAFVYRFTTDVNADSTSGNFLAPFEIQVWVFSSVTVAIVILIWFLVVWIKRKVIGMKKIDETEEDFLLKTLAAICQQGLDPIPRSTPSRTIIFTLFVFTLVMYNYYTSSVVGGLLNSSGQGPKTIAEVVNSPLKLAFEDIGYYKVLFKDSKSPLVHRMHRTKVLPKRRPGELQVFTQLKKAIPYLKKGGYALHCELVDAYPEIARLFDANEICDLRFVSGLLETEVLNWIIPKNSMYTELFRIIMCRAREVGIIKRIQRVHKPERPQCQSAYTVYPVAFSGVASAFMVLGAGMIASLIALAGELLAHKMKKAK